MSSMSNATPTTEHDLTSTLVLALTQCRDQNQQLAEQRERIEQLSQENRCLREELEQQRTRSDKAVEARHIQQFQEAFRQVAEKQAEIDHLKEKLRAAKTKARHGGHTDLSAVSPALPLGEQQHYTPRTLPSPVLSGKVEEEIEEIRPLIEDINARPGTERQARKRSRSRSQPSEPLQELDPNVIAGDVRTDPDEKVKRQRRMRRDEKKAAIRDITEDGEDYSHVTRRAVSDSTTKALPGSIYHRLGDLLDATEPTSPRLLGDTINKNLTPENKILLDSTPARPSSLSFGLPTPSTDTRFKRPKSPSATTKQASILNIGQKPVRSRPVDELRLVDFKLNPATNSGLEYAFNETIRGEERKCLPGCTRECCVNTFSAVAATLPGFSGHSGRQLSDHDLLLGCLGPGSEAKIKDLTPKARENLIHEARTKLVADAYGKMHRDIHDRGRSPPGFWRTDMPGTQEAKGDRELAKKVERDEVRRRYHEALREGGRWMFADE